MAITAPIASIASRHRIAIMAKPPMPAFSVVVDGSGVVVTAFVAVAMTGVGVVTFAGIVSSVAVEVGVGVGVAVGDIFVVPRGYQSSMLYVAG